MLLEHPTQPNSLASPHTYLLLLQEQEEYFIVFVGLLTLFWSYWLVFNLRSKKQHMMMMRVMVMVMTKGYFSLTPPLSKMLYQHAMQFYVEDLSQMTLTNNVSHIHGYYNRIWHCNLTQDLINIMFSLQVDKMISTSNCRNKPSSFTSACAGQ